MDRTVTIPTVIPIEDAYPKSSLAFLSENTLAQQLRNGLDAFASRRAAMGLSNPGTIDGISREVQRDVFLNNLMFQGLRADLTTAFSAAPLFQTAHNLTMGGQHSSPYSFAALYGSPKVSISAQPLLSYD